MARRKAAEATQELGQASNPVPVGEVVDQVIENAAARSEPATQVANVTYNNARKLPDKLGIPVGDLRVQLIDKGDNNAGIGVRVLYPDGREPTGEEKEIIRDVMKEETNGFPSGFRWRGDMGMWHKEIGDVAGPRASAIRLDAERRVESIAKNLRELHGIEYSHADTVEESKGQGAEPIPF